MKVSRRSFLFSLFSFLGLLAGCATLPERPPVSDPGAVWAARQQELKPLTTWELHGRVALRTRDEGWHASLVWVRNADRHDIDLTGPLGGGHVRLTEDRSGAELRDADNKVLRASNAEQLLWRATGWQLPLDGLDYWVLGLPAPGTSGEQEVDAWGRLKTLHQSGWNIQFLGYVPCGDVELPNKLFIRRDKVAAANPDETLEVRLVIDRWALSKRDP